MKRFPTRCGGALAIVLLAVAAEAQTPTPPPAATPTPTCTPRATPAECAGARKFLVTWTDKDPGHLRLAVSATNCPQVPPCSGGLPGRLVSQPPIGVRLGDANGLVAEKTLSAPGINVGGCVGGHDTYRDTDRLRFVFGESGSTTVLGKVRMPYAFTVAPGLTAPVTVTVRDRCGTLYRATATTCFTRATPIRTDVKCF